MKRAKRKAEGRILLTLTLSPSTLTYLDRIRAELGIARGRAVDVAVERLRRALRASEVVFCRVPGCYNEGMETHRGACSAMHDTDD